MTETSAPTGGPQSIIIGTTWDASTSAVIWQAGHNIANAAVPMGPSIGNGELSMKSEDKIYEVTNYFFYEGLDQTSAQARAALVSLNTSIQADRANSPCAVTTLGRMINYTIALIDRANNGESLQPHALTPYPHGEWPHATCPWPAQVDSIDFKLSVDGTQVTASWPYPSNTYHFLFQQYVAATDTWVDLTYRADSNDWLPTSSPTDTISAGLRTVTVPMLPGTPARAKFRALACSGLNCLGPEKEIWTIRPNAPTNMIFTFDEMEGLTVSWVAPAPSPALAEYYVVTRTPTAGPTNTTTTGLIDTGVFGGSLAFTYYVTACNTAGCSAPLVGTYTFATAPVPPPVTPVPTCGQVHDNRNKQKCKKPNPHRYGYLTGHKNN